MMLGQPSVANDNDDPVLPLLRTYRAAEARAHLANAEEARSAALAECHRVWRAINAELDRSGAISAAYHARVEPEGRDKGEVATNLAMVLLEDMGVVFDSGRPFHERISAGAMLTNIAMDIQASHVGRTPSGALTLPDLRHRGMLSAKHLAAWRVFVPILHYRAHRDGISVRKLFEMETVWGYSKLEEKQTVVPADKREQARALGGAVRASRRLGQAERLLVDRWESWINSPDDWKRLKAALSSH